ncbi:EAL domain-containing protein [uncultured Pseudoteredinibacter sp.]|uniref:EAL domain-containing protein n=1 Tax=uncultured Pseudoteredinibacter sp. TaxID=1641701 RepID=UPI00260F2CA4|nr:EAL domain-containing protein [uncultured Pseudoteredinibacter sp.]
MLYRRLLVSVIGFLTLIYAASGIALNQELSVLQRETLTDSKDATIVQQERLAMHLHQRDIPYANEQSLTIIRDSLGYYWLGTGLGLIRYDGNESNKVVSNASGDATGSVVLRLLEHKGYIWAGTAAQGLFRVDLDDHSIKSYAKGEGISHGYVTGLIEDQYQRFWVLTIDGLNLYHAKSDNFQQFFLPRKKQSNSTPAYAFKTLVALDRNTLLLSSFSEGVLLFDLRSQTFTSASQSLTQVSDKEFKHFLTVAGGELLRTAAGNYVYGVDDKLFEFDRTGRLIHSAAILPEKLKLPLQLPKKSLKNVQIRRLTADHHGNIWIVPMGGGLFQWSADRKIVYHSFNAANNTLGIGNPYNINVDKDGTLALSYLKSSPRFWNPIGSQVKTIDLRKANAGLRDFQAFIAIEGEQGTWLFGDSDHFLLLDHHGQLSRLVEVPGQLIGAAKRGDQLYISTYRGIYRYDIPTQTLEQLDKIYPANVDVVHKQQVWVRMPTNEVLRIDPQGGQHNYKFDGDFTTVESNFSVSDEGLLYFLARGFLYRYDEKQDRFEKLHQQPLKIHSPADFYVRANELYLFSEGAYRLSLDELDDSQFATKLLRGNRFFRRVHCSTEGCWLRNDHNSDLEFFEFNSEKWFDYYHTQGFPFLRGVTPLKYKAGELWLSSHGVVYKVQSPLPYANSGTPTKIHSFSLFSSDQPQETYLSPFENIELGHDVSAIRLNFGDGQFYKNGDEKPMYRLLGLSKQWLSASHNQATFTALNPGEYIFQVKPEAADKVSDQLIIRVTAAWWNSWLARSIYLISALSILLLLIYLRWDKYRSQYLANKKILEYAKGIDGVNQGVCVIESNGRIVSANRAFKAFIQSDVSQRFIWEFVHKLNAEDDFEQRWLQLREQRSIRGRLRLRSPSRAMPVEYSISIIDQLDHENSRYIALFSDISERIEHENELRDLASCDTLTGLHNRYYLNLHLRKLIHSEVEKNGKRLALVFLDVDRFKNINDSLSHYYGDMLLVALAKRLKSCLRAGEFLARLGGDEFVIVSCQTASNWDVTQLAQRVLAQADQAIVVEDKELYVSLSLGLAVSPDDGASVDELLRNADAAMYSVKAKGGNDYAFYTQRMSETSRLELELESELRRAIDQREFRLYYQPKICLATGRLMGLEALLRWAHPQRGLVSPGLFIPVAEKTGLIIKIGLWAIGEVARQLRAWQLDDYDAVPIAVNVSPQQLLQPNFADELNRLLRASHIACEMVELEITENMVMENMEVCIEQLAKLKSMGHLISIDDFGTGYSSLAYLRKLPIDVLKIDQSFVSGMFEDAEQHSIVKTIIELANNLQLTVVAEGIETKEVHFTLRDMGCSLGQGYFYAPPMAADDPFLKDCLKEGEIKIPLHLGQRLI